jgi:hypothetical protein
MSHIETLYHILAPCTICCCNLAVGVNTFPTRLLASFLLKPCVVNLSVNHVSNRK